MTCQSLSSKWPPPRRDEGACPLRPVTETQRRRRAIFNSTLRAAVLWSNFGVARSASIAMDTGASLASLNSPKLLAAIGKPYRLHNTNCEQVRFTYSLALQRALGRMALPPSGFSRQLFGSKATA